jgi:hypothetical protein
MSLLMYINEYEYAHYDNFVCHAWASAFLGPKVFEADGTKNSPLQTRRQGSPSYLRLASGYFLLQHIRIALDSVAQKAMPRQLFRLNSV